MSYVCPNKKTNKIGGSGNGLPPKFGPTMKRNPSESINSQSTWFQGGYKPINPSKLVPQ